MKILIVTPRIPYPPYRGDKLKIFNIAKQLAENNDVNIITFRRNRSDLQYLERISNYGINIQTTKLSYFRSLINLITAIFSDLPFQVAWFKSSKMKKLIDKVISEEDFDVVYYHLIRSVQYFNSYLSAKPIQVADYTDAVSLYLMRFLQFEKNPLKKMIIKIEQKRVSNYEKISKKFNTLFICSEIDKRHLINSGIKTNIKILPNGVDTKYFHITSTEYDKSRIIFTGNMPYFANQDAAIFFAEQIFPLVLNEIPDAEFYIVGQNPSKRVKRLKSDKIIVTGFVPDIKLEYLKSAVNVAPMRFGAGTLNKIIESILLGIPVVATSISVDGLPAELKEYIFIADSKKEFSQKVIYVLRHPEVRQDFISGGINVVKDLLSWEVIVKSFENDLKKKLIKA